MTYSLSAVKAIIEKDNKYLFLTQKLVSGKIIFDIPGGKVEKDENPYETLKREVKEEIGIEIEINEPVGLFWFNNEKLNMQIVCTAFKCKAKSYEFNIDSNPADENILEYKWLTLDEIINSDKILNKSLKELFKKLN